MKRFYCTVCKKVKRVRQYPKHMDTLTTLNNPTDRVGACNRHYAPSSNVSYIRKVGR